MTRLANYVYQFLADRGVTHTFLVTGGGAMFLNNAIREEPRLIPVCNHHEQACAMAAEAYARITGRPAVVNVTTGPGSINALNGVFGAWTDSIPMLVLSGQVKRETLLATYQIPGLRQLGDQEVDILSMVRSITKYAALVTDPQSIGYHLQRAWHLASAGRPGPCWLDIPIDVQSAQIDPQSLRPYDPAEDTLHWDPALIDRQAREVIELLASAKRPVILAGTGVRIAGALEKFQKAIAALGIPVTTAWTHDLLASDHPLFCGRQGTIGDRAGNFAVQNADVLLVLGSRLAIRQISYNWKAFARCARIIQVDIDPAELAKPTVRPQVPVHCDVALFLEQLLRQIPADMPARHAAWLDWCRQRRAKYPVVLPKHRQSTGLINPYHFIETLFERLADHDIIACGNATACIIPFQVARLKPGQRLFSNSGSASMGYDLPAAIGAALAAPDRRVICLAGDGSIQMNLQELQTLVHLKLNVKIFVLANGGYLSIRTSQQNFFGHVIGAGADSGVSFPDMCKIAAAYGLPTQRLDSPSFPDLLSRILAAPGPSLTVVELDPVQAFEPRPSSRQLPDGRIVTAPLEDLFPFLDEPELRSNLLIPKLD